MENKEILAELKQSYEYLYDIRENGCSDHCSGQLGIGYIPPLNISMECLEDMYNMLWKDLYKNGEDLTIGQKTQDGEDILISDVINCDYLIFSTDKEQEDTYITCSDLDYYWYKEIIGG